MTEAVAELSDAASDAALIMAVRAGGTAAYGVLYERHLGAARRAAASMVATSAEREDLVAEAFARVLRIIRAGHGPHEAFRPYLLTTLRNAMISWARGPTLSPVAEIPEARLADRRDGGDDHDDLMGADVQATVAADAFASLPERWRMVLWHTEVEGESPAQIAPMLGMTPNGVAALAYRAREGLRQAYLQQHLPDIDRRDCRKVTGQLAGWVRRGFTAPKMRRITTHLDQCQGCREIATGLRQINSQLPATVAPIILGAPLAVAYLSATSSLTAAPAILAVAGTGSWLTTVKMVVAGAAIATTTAISPASDPVLAHDDPGVAIASPREQPRAGQQQPATGGPGAAGRPNPGDPNSSHSPIVPTIPSGTATDNSTDPGATAAETKAEKLAKREAKQEAKAETKADKKAENAEAKADKKAEKAEAKAEEKATKKEAKKTK